jgi:hypothetical protein
MPRGIGRYSWPRTPGTPPSSDSRRKRWKKKTWEEEDLDRFEELAREREEIQEEVGSGPPIVMPKDYLDPEDQEFLEKVHEEIRDALLCDARIRDRLQKLKKTASTDIKTMEGRGGQAKEYLTGEDARSTDRPHQLNVRL